LVTQILAGVAVALAVTIGGMVCRWWRRKRRDKRKKGGDIEGREGVSAAELERLERILHGVAAAENKMEAVVATIQALRGPGRVDVAPKRSSTIGSTPPSPGGITRRVLAGEV
jgi:hypothetical protein